MRIVFNRTTPLTAALAVFTASAAFAVTSSALASTTGALNRCNGRQQGDATTSQLTIPGNGGVFVGGGLRQDPRTPLWDQIRPGDVVAVFAGGRVSYGGFFGSAGTWGPDGNGRMAPSSTAYPFPNGPQYALVGSWNHALRRERIGSVSPCIVVPDGGDGFSVPWGLWLLPNDDDRSDNGGSYSAVVHLWKADLSP
jgi:hypothetical protein